MTQRVYFPGKALRRIDVQVRLRGMEPIGDLRDGLNDPGLVVDVHHADKQRVGAKRRTDRVGIHHASLIGRDERHVEPALAELGERFQHGMVLDRRRHDVASFAPPPLPARESPDCCFPSPRW